MGKVACALLGVLLMAALATSISRGSVRGSRGGSLVYEINRSTNPVGFWIAITAFGGFALLCLWGAIH